MNCKEIAQWVSIPVFFFVFARPAFTDTMEVKPNSVRLVHTKRGFITKEKLEVIANGETLLSFRQIEGYDTPFPSLEHIKNFYELKIREAVKMGVSIKIVTSYFPQSNDSIEGKLGPGDPKYAGDYIQEELVVAPNRIKVYRDRKTKAVFIRIDGLEVFRRKTGIEWGYYISEPILDDLYKRTLAILEQATSESKPVLVRIGNFWESSSPLILKNALILSDQPVPTEAQLKSHKKSSLELKRRQLVTWLREIDADLDRLEKNRTEVGNEHYQNFQGKRQRYLQQLKDLDAQLDALEERPTENTVGTSEKLHSTQTSQLVN